MLVYSFDGSAIARKYAEPVFESTTFPFCLFTGGDAAHKHVLELVERLREQFFGEAMCREILVKNTINELWIEVYRQFSTPVRQQKRRTDPAAEKRAELHL